MTQDDDDDRPLAERYLTRRDAPAFDALYGRHAPRMYGLALRLTGGREADARDITQEAWLRALPRLAGFRWQSRLSTWLCGFCVNVWRENERRSVPELRIEAADERRAVGKASTHEPIDVERAVAGLASGYRAVLVLHTIYGYPHAEVATMLGIDEGTSKSQLARARKALLRALGEDDARETTA